MKLCQYGLIFPVLVFSLVVCAIAMSPDTIALSTTSLPYTHTTTPSMTTTKSLATSTAIQQEPTNVTSSKSASPSCQGKSCAASYLSSKLPFYLAIGIAGVVGIFVVTFCIWFDRRRNSKKVVGRQRGDFRGGNEHLHRYDGFQEVPR